MKPMTQCRRLSAFLGGVLAGMTIASTPALAAGTPQASITLTNCNSEICNANNTDWTLGKTTQFPSVTGSSTISWTVAATRDGTTHNFITVDGVITVTNTGTAPATIGNIVVNLQKPRTGPNTGACRNVPWVSAAADAADATSGDNATSANIVAAASTEVVGCNAVQGPPNYTVSGAQGTFAETSASGALEFTDASSNTAFSLTPQVSLAPNASITLLYTAKFDNTVLGLPVGSQVRAEALVSFGNAGARGGSGATASNIDINGDGCVDGSPSSGNCTNITLDADEANVRTVPCRVTKGIPALQKGNDSVTLSDQATDVAVAGTNVAVSNFSTDIGLNNTGSGESISATTNRSVSVDEACTPPGSATVTNTAHLKGDSSSVTVQGPQIGTDPITGQPIYQTFTFACVTGVALDAPSDVAVSCEAPPPTTPNACTYTKGGYAGTGTPGQLFDSNFDANSGLTVGTVGAATNDATWKVSASPVCDANCVKNALKTYLNSSTGGNNTALTADTLNATSTSGGNLPRQTAALTLNVGFGIVNTSFPTLPATPAVDTSGFGDLKLCNLADGSTIGTFTLNGTQAAALNGKTVSQVLGDANTTLGDGNVCSNNNAITCDPSASATTIHTLCGSNSAQCVVKTLPAYVGSAGNLNQIVDQLNQSFDNCSASAFASAYLCKP